MPTPTKISPTDCALDLTGTITIPPDAEHPQPRRIVRQGTIPIFASHSTPWGAPRQVRAHIIPYDPRTSAQLEQRARLRAAVAAWQALDESERAALRAAAGNTGLTAYMRYCSAHIRGSING